MQALDLLPSNCASWLFQGSDDVSKRVAVLMGGRSAEREISLLTGEEIYKALLSSSYQALKIEADEMMWENLKKEKPDAVFIALHGRWGEDGTVQGMLEVLDIPYTGSGVLASALGIDKAISKLIFQAAGIETPRFVLLTREKRRSTKAMKEFISEVGFPLAIKPRREGSTIGLSIVRSQEEVDAALEKAFLYDDALIEEFIEGKEVTVGILGNEDLLALPSLEIDYDSEIYDFESKYTPGMSRHIIPARISKRQEKEIQELALAAHRALGCRGFSRVDLIVGKEKIVVLEVNTIPGMTSLSLFPDAARAAGIEFPQLISRIVELALEKKKF